MQLAEFEQARDDHRYLLSGLIQEGEQIVAGSKILDVIDFDGGFSRGDVEATVRTLRTAFRCEHESGRNPERVTKVLRGVFNAAGLADPANI